MSQGKGAEGLKRNRKSVGKVPPLPRVFNHSPPVSEAPALLGKQRGE